MILDDDDSLRGRVTEVNDPIIKEKKSIYKSGVEHRFYISPESRYRADRPILRLYKNNKWRSVREIVDETGMAERTIQYACRRLVKHKILEERKQIKLNTDYRRRRTRLYRLITKSKNGTRTNPKKYENHKKR